MPRPGSPRGGRRRPSSLKEQAEPGFDLLKLKKESQTQYGTIVSVAEVTIKLDCPAYITNPLVK